MGAHSAALWPSGADSAAGALDDAQDFARNNVLASARGQDPYRRMPVWIDVGDQDPFRASDTALADELRAQGQRLDFHVWPGSHGQSYWQSHWRSYLGFYATALQRAGDRDD